VSAVHVAAHFADDDTARSALGCGSGWTLLRSRADPTLYFAQNLHTHDAEAGDGLEECEVIFDDEVRSDVPDAWCFHVTVRVKPGGDSVYERWKLAEGEGQRAARGFIKRTLLRSKADPSLYYYQSFWESEAACQAYSQSEAFTATFARLNPAASFAQPMARDDCEIVLDQSARPSFSPS
jgi:heme-degrading monooxygenase HmoA